MTDERDGGGEDTGGGHDGGRGGAAPEGAAGMGSVWTRKPRAPREQLTRAKIVAEAIRLLDAEGIEALSMRTLGQRLGAGATSFYRHVASKDELIELAVDVAYGEILVPEVREPVSWRLAATAVAHSTRQAGLRHPWMMQSLGQVGMTYLGPNVLSVTSRSLAIYTLAGLDDEEASQALNSVSAYVMGVTIAEVGWLTALRRSGLDESNWEEVLRPEMERMLAEGGRENLRQYATRLEGDARSVRERNFAYGLDRMLDGVQLRVDARLGEGAVGRGNSRGA